MAGNPQTIALFGASGELGHALARQFAAGGASLHISGRDSCRLEALAATCIELGATDAQVLLADLADVDTALDRLRAIDTSRPLDMIVFASGLGDIRTASAAFEDAETVARLILVNFLAPAALSAEMANRMAARGRGTIVLVGSAASFHALPFAAAYASSKSGLASFADALAAAMRPHGVSVTLVSPGFIDTAAGRRTPGPKPFILSPEQAAEQIIAAAAASRPHLITPAPFRALRWIDRLLPRRVRHWLLRQAAPPGL